MAAPAPVDPCTVKLLIIGDSSVGKSCLLMRFCEDKFDPGNLATIGIDFRSKTVMQPNGRQLKLQVWDTAGQERFRVISRAYYRGANGILVVFDLTSDTTFEQVQGWMDSISQNVADKVAIVLVGNKMDREDRAVTREQGEAVARRLGVPYFETSAKTGENVETVFMELAKQIAPAGAPAPAPGTAGALDLATDSKKGKKGKKGCC